MFKEKTKKRVRRRTGVDEQGRRFELDRKVRAQKLLDDQMERDPELVKAYITQTLGLDWDKLDPAERQKAEAKAMIMKETMKAIEADPELRQRLVQSRMREILDLPPEEGEDYNEEGEVKYGANPIRDMLDNFREMKEFQEEMGGGNGNAGSGGMMSEVMNSQVMVELIKQIPMLLGRAPAASVAPSAGAEERVVIVMVDGQPIEMPESQYVALSKTGKALEIKEIGSQPPLAQVTAAAAVEDRKGAEAQREDVESYGPAIHSVGDEEPGIEKPAAVVLESKDKGVAGMVVMPEYIKDLLRKLPTEELMRVKAGDIGPQEFVDGLIERAQSDPAAEQVRVYLVTSNAAVLSSLIALFVDDEEFGDFAIKLSSGDGRVWLEEVILLLQPQEE